MDNAHLIDDSKHEEPDRRHEECYTRLFIQCQYDENEGEEGQNQIIDERIQRHAEWIFRSLCRFRAAVFQLAQNHHGPDENEAEGGDAGDEYEYAFRHDVVQDDGEEDDSGREERSLGRHTAFGKLLH